MTAGKKLEELHALHFSKSELGLTREESALFNTLREDFLKNEKIVKRLEAEIKAVKSLTLEKHELDLTNEKYLNNLEWILAARNDWMTCKTCGHSRQDHAIKYDYIENCFCYICDCLDFERT